MRKITVTLLAFLALMLAVPAGSAWASSKLEDTIAPLIGTKYKYGGTTTSGFDCSGFTRYVFLKLGLELPRSSKEQFHVGVKVSKEELRPGDLVFFNTSGKGVSHVGIYVGNGKFAHASTSKGVVYTSMNDKYYSQRYLGARRVMDTATYQALAVDLPEVAAEPTEADENAEAADDAESVEAADDIEVSADEGLAEEEQLAENEQTA